jgi:hypothetical protein
MRSDHHRANILDARLREAGVGYYRNAEGAGYVVLDLAADQDYAPLVIDGEAATTPDTQVHLYLYDQDSGGNWQGVAATRSMMISNLPDFAGAQWEPYAHEREWTLAPGEGWRTVYVKTRDSLGRTTIVHDSIYLGSQIPDAALSLAYATQVDVGFVLDPLAAGAYSHIQFSINWLADDTDENFALGAGERINDAAAAGGNAYRLGPAPAVATNWRSSPLGIQAGVAYFRLKISDNSSAQPAATLTVGDGSQEVGVRHVAANEFAVAGQYQEFAVSFSPSATSTGLLVLTVIRHGPGELIWDTTELYTAPQRAAAPYTFTAPGGYHRAAGVRARFITPGEGGAIEFASTAIEVYPHLRELSEDPPAPDPAIRVTPAELAFSAPNAAGGLVSGTVVIACPACGTELTWVVNSSAGWLTANAAGGYLQVQANPAALGPGIHTATITLSVASRPDIAAIRLPVTLTVGQVGVQLPPQLFIPAVMRR